MTPELIISIILGFCLSAAAGFRVFIPLVLLSFATHFEIFPVSESWQWVGSIPALVLLSAAAIFEALAYLIPWLDNLLDTVAVPLAAIAGTLIMVATVGDIDPVYTWALAIIAGGGTAAAISGTTSVTRAASTATTGGFGNPVIAVAETGTATAVSLATLASPLIALAILVILFGVVRRLVKKLKRKQAIS